jgi:hypothetical protein
MQLHARLTNQGRGAYNGPNTTSQDEDDERSCPLLNFGRRGYNTPRPNLGPAEEEGEEEDGRRGYN